MNKKKTVRKNTRFDLEEEVGSPMSMSMAGLSEAAERQQSPDLRKRETLVVPQPNQANTFNVDELMSDDEQMQKIKMQYEQDQKVPNGKTQNEKKLQEQKQLMKAIFDMLNVANGRHNAIKQEMKYKFPHERIQEKIEKMIR